MLSNKSENILKIVIKIILIQMINIKSKIIKWNTERVKKCQHKYVADYSYDAHCTTYIAINCDNVQ